MKLSIDQKICFNRDISILCYIRTKTLMLHKQKVAVQLVIHRGDTQIALTGVQNRFNFCAKKQKFWVCFDFGDYKMFVVGAITKIARKLL